MKETLDGDYAREYLTTVMADHDDGNDELSGNAYNRVIDMEWVEMIEGKLPYIEKAIDEQRKFIEEHKEVDRIDKVKQVGKDAVQHLTQHANLIMAIEPDGSVIPERLLNTHREDSFATYENRFLHTLIFKTIAFVEARFRALQDAPNDSSNQLAMQRKLDIPNQKVTFNINYSFESHDRDKVDREADIASLSDYERIERIRMRLDDFVGTDLMKSLKGCIAVKSPINKTNCIKQDPAFKQCYDLWVFIEGYRKSGYVLEKNVFEGQMPEDVQKDMYDVMAFQHFVATINTNHALREKLKAEYEAENERRAREANRPEDEMARYIDDQIYKARREEMQLRLKEVREREVLIAKLNAELEQAKEQIRVRDAKIRELESIINATKKELEQTREELRKAQLRVVELEKENEELRIRNAELEAKFAELMATIEAHLAAIAALQADVVEKQKSIDQLSSVVDKLKVRLEEVMEEVKERDNTIAEKTKEIETANSQVAALTNTVGALTADNSTLKNTIADQERTILQQAEDIVAKTETIAHQTDQIKRLDEKLGNLQSDYDGLVERYSNYQKELDSLNSTISEDKSNISELEHQIRVHLNTISAKNAIITTLRDEKNAMTDRIETIDQREAKAAAEVRAARDRVAEIETECVGLNNTVAAYVASFAKRDERISELESRLYSANVEKEAGMKAVRDEYEAKMAALTAQYEAKIEQLEAQTAAACSFTDDQKYTIRLNAEKRKMQKEYDAKLSAATKKAREFVRKARVLVDDRPDVVLRLDGADDYRR
jgi:predicted  nucleic acid-binding Zn-ribbon protein